MRSGKRILHRKRGKLLITTCFTFLGVFQEHPLEKFLIKKKDKLPLFWKFRVPLHHLRDNATIGVEIFQKTKLWNWEGQKKDQWTNCKMNSPKKWVLFWISYILAAKRPNTKLICSPNFSFAVRERFRYQIWWIFGKVPKGGGTFSMENFCCRFWEL